MLAVGADFPASLHFSLSGYRLKYCLNGSLILKQTIVYFEFAHTKLCCEIASKKSGGWSLRDTRPIYHFALYVTTNVHNTPMPSSINREEPR